MRKEMFLMRATIITVILATILMLILGCSGGSNIAPAPPISGIASAMDRMPGGGSHFCFGLWQMVADPAAGTLDVIAARESAFHLNALPFLEPPALINLSLENLEFNGNEIIADIGLRHPFLGLTEFTGFDVCGVFISNGTHTFGETGLVYADGDDTHLMNPDGLTRWWNPDDFPQDGTIFNYKDGLLGTPDNAANFNTGLNPYKYYSNELDDIDDDILQCTTEARGQFSAGQKNVRRFHILMGNDGLVFNYAVDANWVFPNGDPPYSAPGDFPEDANRPEPWAIDVNITENTLFNDGSASGGSLALTVDVYDHYNGELNTLRLQSAGNFDEVIDSSPVGGGDGYSTYEIDIPTATPDEGSIPLCFIIDTEEEGYSGKIPGEPISAYFIRYVDVSGIADWIHVDVPNGGEMWEMQSEKEIQWTSNGPIDAVTIEYSKDGFVDDVNSIIASTDNDGSFMWTVPVDPSDTVRVRISDVDAPSLSDTSDADFSIVEPDNIIHVDDDNVSGPWDGSAAHPFKLVQDGVDAVTEDGSLIWVHPGTYYEDDGGSQTSGYGELTISALTDLTIYGEDLPILAMPMYLGTGKAAVHVYNSPGFTIDGIGFSHNYAYQSAIWLETCTNATIKNCEMVATLSPHVYGFLEFLRASNSPGLTAENNDLDDFNTASTYMSLFVISSCNDSVITLNTCRNMNPNTGYNLYQTGEAYISIYNSSNVEISKNIIGDHHRSCSSENYVQLYCIYITGGSGNTVRNNLIYDCYFRNNTGVNTNNRAIFITGSPDAVIYNNTIDRFGPTSATGTGYSEGIYYHNSTGATVYNNIITNITNPYLAYGANGLSAFTQTYSDVWTIDGPAPSARYGGSAVEGTGGIDEDPLYADPLNEDYTLLAGSPCEGTGDGGDDMGCHGGSDPLP